MLPGMGGINPQQMQRMMSQMGIKTEEIKAKRVVIEMDNHNLVIELPNITKMTIQGTETYQLVGKAQIVESAKELVISEDDIDLVSSQANVTKDKAKEALNKTNGDIAKAILSLQK